MASVASHLSHLSEDVRRVRFFTAALVCFRAKHRAQERIILEQRRVIMRQLQDIELQLISNHFKLIAAASLLSTTPRSWWCFRRSQHWFEETQPNLGEAYFKRCFRVSAATFRYIVELCRTDMQRVDTTMREAISVEKRVAVSLYRLCSAAEDRTIAELFAIGRSTENLLYKEFCTAVLKNLEDDWVKMPSPTDMEEHMREFFAVTGFPQGVGALDGCHFPVSPPKKYASDYYNYKGW
ncbi:hypothetical protein HPB51_016213 [Rhipicephalus microplus]|uniref:DDE Tnp4 domain-containing protein n=1 Tax=Rhipicephalus microplus TaxID=6941 RepID=A0A9J6EAP1_RHIMP|nr:hypothetical protein HPB51_016213 [Rhipicephalus microplus]